MACDFQQCGILTSVDSDEPVQPPVKLRTSKRCSVCRLIVIKYSSNKQRLLSCCAYAQADLSPCWSHKSHCWKSHALAQIVITFLSRLNICFGCSMRRFFWVPTTYILVEKWKNMAFITQVSYRFLTAENLRLVLSRGSFLLWWRGGLVP